MRNRAFLIIIPMSSLEQRDYENAWQERRSEGCSRSCAEKQNTANNASYCAHRTKRHQYSKSKGRHPAYRRTRGKWTADKEAVCTALLGRSFSNLKINFVRKQLKCYREQVSGGAPVLGINWSRKRKECGRGVQKFTAEIAQKLIDNNNRNWGRLSFKRLASKLGEEGVDVSPVTVWTWYKALQMRRRR